MNKFVCELKEIPYEELLGWIEYFNKRPLGWREDDRAFKIMQSWGLKASAGEVFPSLQAIATPEKSKTRTSGKDLKGTILYQKLLSAKGGEKIGE